MSEREPKKKKEEITYDPTNERLVIGMALAERKRRDILVRTVAPDELMVPEHSAMWRALHTMTTKNLEHDPAIFLRLCKDEMPEIDADYVSGLEAAATVPTNSAYIIETLRFDSMRARVIKDIMPDLITDLRDPKASGEKLASMARALLRTVEGGGSRQFIRRGDELSRAYISEMAQRRLNGNYYSTGYDVLDASLTEGAMPERMAVVVGLSGCGKSTFSGDWAIRLAKLGRRVMYGCWEMPEESTIDVMVAGMLGIELERIVQGEITDEESVRVSKAVTWITQRIKFMPNAAFFTPEVRRAKGRPSNDRMQDIFESQIAQSGCDVVFADLFERCLVDLSPDAVQQALYRQQAMFQEYKVYGVILHQLRLKDVEKRSDKRPTREAIKGSAGYVEVPDQIFGLHRDAQFKAVVDDSLEVICMKQRKGVAFFASRFDWDGERARISGGVPVPYDPGLESSAAFGDIADVKISRAATRRPGSKPHRPNRREA